VWKKLRKGSKDFEMLVFPPPTRSSRTPHSARAHHTPSQSTALPGSAAHGHLGPGL